MASGSLAFDNESPASGAQVQLTVGITDYQNDAVSLQAMIIDGRAAVEGQGSPVQAGQKVQA